MWPTSSRSRPPLALLLLACLALACATPLTIDQERKLGDEFSREIRREITLFRDEVVQAYVEDIGRSIVEAAGTQPFTYHFYVVEDEDLNAFAAPAGHVYLNTGIILNARNVGEVAGVMAHEVGHVAKRHVAHNYNRQRTTGLAHQAAVIAAGMLGGQAAAGATNLLGGIGAMSYLNTFTRDAEREADAFAIEVLPRAGYHPEGMVTFFQTLRNEGGPRPPPFLSSHPTTDERIENARRMIAATPLPPGLRRDDGGRFEIIQHRVRVRSGGGAAAPDRSRR